MKASVLKDEFRKAGALQTLLHLYTHGLMMQVSCTVVCNRIHKIEERLSRWLLMVRDRLDSDEFRLTHDLIADMLGVRRAGVSLAAGTLQKAGLIRYAHGRITIIDRKGLEAVACECYGIVADFLNIRKC
jgi:CRP-like cAMP-binding protein